MERSRTSKQAQVLALIRNNPFVSQQELAEQLGLSRSAIASHISALTQAGEILGRAYILPNPERITCIGGANVDRKIQSNDKLQLGTSNPATVHEAHGGVARNIAENLGRLGANVQLLTMVGQDAAGEALLAHCSSVGVDTANAIRLDQHNTGTYTAVLDAGGEMAVALADMAIYDDFSEARLAQRWHAIGASKMVVMDTNLPAASLQYLLERAHAERLAVCIAPVSSPKARRLPQDLRGVHLMIANLDETAAITGLTVESLDDVWVAADQLIARGCSQIVITMGKRGCAYVTAAGATGTVPAEHVDVVDVTGAGDAFVAGVVYTLADRPDEIDAACRFGTRLSRLTLATRHTVSRELGPELAGQWLAQIQPELQPETKGSSVE